MKKLKSKRLARVNRVKAWARIDGLGVICTHNYKGDFPYPCTILINRKYLPEGKNGKMIFRQS